MQFFALSHRNQTIAAVLLLAATIMLSATYVRAEWDVAYARYLAAGLFSQFPRRWMEGERCPDLRDLPVFGKLTTASPYKLDLVSHGLHCSVWRDGAQVPCRIVIRIGNPVLVRQIVQIEDHSRLRIQETMVHGGILRSLQQKIGEPDE